VKLGEFRVVALRLSDLGAWRQRYSCFGGLQPLWLVGLGDAAFAANCSPLALEIWMRVGSRRDSSDEGTNLENARSRSMQTL
jgi:hypothetical protein